MAKYDTLIDLDTDYRGTDDWEYTNDSSEEELDSTLSDTNPPPSSYDSEDAPLLLSKATDYSPASKTILRSVVHEMPPSYLKLSIFSYIFCCWLLGIMAIIKSMEVSEQWANGNIAASITASERAKYWNKLCIMIGLLCYLIIALAIALKVGVSYQEYG